MSKRRSGKGRRIVVVDGVEYTWRMGSYLRVWKAGQAFLTISHERLMGVDCDYIERGLWKGYGDNSALAVKPRHVAKAIREWDAGNHEVRG